MARKTGALRANHINSADARDAQRQRRRSQRERDRVSPRRRNA